jgi:hypothetical protein
MILYRRRCGNDLLQGEERGGIEMAIETLVWDIARYGVLALKRECDTLRISTRILARVNIHLDSQQRLI